MISEPRLPSRFPAATCAMLLIWALGSVGILALWHHRLSPLEVFYLPTYAKSVLPEIHMTRGTHPQRYMVAYAGYVMATDETLAVAQPGQVSVKPVTLTKRWMDWWLQRGIYHDDTFPQLLIVPAIASGLWLLFCLWIAVPIDLERRRKRREGVLLRGPELLTVKQFNRRVKGDGLEFWLK
jgi:hypothetical protein